MNNALSFRSCAALLCAVLALLLSLPATAQPRPPRETLKSLLAKHLKAAATPAALRDKSAQKIVYAISAAGMTGTLTEYNAPPKKSRVEMVLGPLHQVTADNGTVQWQQDSTGNVRLIRGDELAENRAASAFSLESYDPIKDAKKGRITLRPQREPGTGDYILDLAPVGGTTQTIYLDPRTYLVRKQVVRKGGLVGSVTVLAYRSVRGLKVPSKLQIGYAGLPVLVDANLVRADSGLKLPASLFAPPQSATDFTFLTPGGAHLALLPFEDDHGEIVLPVTINGQKRRFLLDSGAANSFITEKAAESLKLATRGQIPAVGYGGAAKTGIAVHTQVELPGAVRITNQLLYVIQDPGVARALSEKGGVDGALGYDLLARFVVTIDYRNRTLTLTDPNAYQVPSAVEEKGAVLPITLEANTPTVRTAVDGKKTGRFLVDTGDNGAVHLFSGYARENGLMNSPTDPQAQVVLGMGVGGVVQEVVTANHTLALGRFRLTDVPVATLSGQGAGDVTQVNYNAGGIGNQVLAKFTVTFDYKNLRLILEPIPEFTPSLRLVRPLPAKPGAPLVPGVSARPVTVKLAAYQAQSGVLPPHLTLQELLDKHLAALGGKDAVAAIRSTRVTATVETGGLTGTVTTVFAVPDREYEEDKLGILDYVQSYDGKQAWRRDTNGNIRPLGSDEMKDLRNQIFFDTNSYVLPGRIPARMSLRPETEPGTGDYILDALPEGGKPTALYFDPKTFLIVKEQHNDDNVTVTTSYSEYKAVDGVLFPTKQQTTNGLPKYDITVTATRIENNVAVADSLFSRPAAGQKFAFIHPGATSATVPFDLDDDQIGLTVTIDGRPERVFLDSGASGIALSKTVADDLKLAQSGYLEARGYGGSNDLTPVKIDSFEVPGAVRLTGVTGVAIGLPALLDQFLGHPLAGFVGYDLLSHFVVRVDYARKRLTFIDPKAFHPRPSDGQALPIELDNDIPTVTARLDTLPPGRFLVDTGDAGAALRLYSPYVAKHNLTAKYPRGVASVGGGIGGISKAVLTRTQLFTLAGVTFRGVPTDFSLDGNTGAGASQNAAGSLGTKLLERFVVTFDYPHSRIFLAANANAARPFDTRTMGIELMEKHDSGGKRRILIVDVAPGSPAERAGLAQGDQVLAVDGTAASTLGFSKVRRLLSPEGGKPSRLLTVRSRSGKSRRVKAALYDPLR